MTFLGFPTQTKSVVVKFKDVNLAVSVQRELQNALKASKELFEYSTKVKLTDGKTTVQVPSEGNVIILLRNVLERIKPKRNKIVSIQGCDSHILGY